MGYEVSRPKTLPNVALLNALLSYPEPSTGGSAVVFTALALRSLVLRYLALPRLFPVNEFTEKDPKSGRYFHNSYLVHPYYMKPTFLNRWGLTAWLTWMLGGTSPGGANGDKYHPEGYTMDEVGPDSKRGVGKQELEHLAQRVQQTRPSGCPFSV